jgi:hypothetical protein
LGPVRTQRSTTTNMGSASSSPKTVTPKDAYAEWFRK